MRHIIVLFIALTLLISACTTGSQSQIIGEYDPTQQSFTGVRVAGNEKKGCAPLPKGFKETDLVGTWEMMSGPSGKMLLNVKDNGTYQQLYEFPAAKYQYKSEWHKWWIENLDSGLILVHFEGLRRCQETCFSYRKKTWYDFCSHDTIIFDDNEAVLLLTGQNNPSGDLPQEITAPNGIILWHPQSDPDSLEPVFRLKR